MASFFLPHRAAKTRYSPRRTAFTLDVFSDYGSEGCVFESRRVQMLDWQGVKARNASQRQPPGGGNLSHFLAIFEVLAFKAPLI
jgi:hypothetical protein